MKNLRIRKNLCSGITVVIIGLFFLLILPCSIKSKVTTVTAAVGPDYLPKLVICGMILCGLTLIGRSLILKKDEIMELELGKEGQVFVYYGLLLGYMTAMRYVGFLIASLAFSALSMWLMESRNWKHYLCTALLVGIIFVAFKYGLRVPLPTVFL